MDSHWRGWVPLLVHNRCFHIGPLSGKTGKLLEEKRAEEPQVLANIRKLFLFGRVELVVMIVMIAAMTLQPGPG